MQTSELTSLPSFQMLVPGQARDIACVYCADLLSWAISRAPEDCAWCTVMGNINAVAVAALADVAAIVLCEGAALDKDAKEKAEAQGICIFSCSLPCFEAGLAIAKHAGLYEDTGP